jgi:NTP pyrophosphatase (non-canonical NTP hydrolase)
MSNQLQGLIELVDAFRDERNWRQFHNPKDLSLSLVLEASEVMEHFQWKNGDAIQKYLRDGGREKIREELADVLIYLLYLSSDLGIDLDSAVREKIVSNAKKYPVDKAKNNATKYDQLK